MKFFVILVAIFTMVATASADANSPCQPAQVGSVGNCFTLNVEKETGVPILVFKTFGWSDGPRWIVEYTIRREDGKLDSRLALEKTKSNYQTLRQELLTLDGLVATRVVVDEEFPRVYFERLSSRPWEDIASDVVKTIRDVIIPGGVIKEVKIRHGN